MSIAERIDAQAPTDPQLAFVARLCEERGYPMPAVYSRRDASLLIDEIRAGLYVPPEWYDAAGAFANGESAYDPHGYDEDVPF